MVTVEQAKEILIKSISPLQRIVRIPLQNALGYVLAEDIFSPITLPSFNQSNVDGYAIKFSSDNSTKFKIVSEIKAGDKVEFALKEGQAARIFTGAKVPDGADAIVMQEYVLVDEMQLIIDSKKEVFVGDCIRKKASQIKKGDLALKKNSVINPSVISFLAMMGINEVEVVDFPKISLIITGNEFQPSNEELEGGKVYESNSMAINAAILNMGLKLEEIVFCRDDKNEILNASKDLLKKADVLIFSGGISVGDYDFVHMVILELNFDVLFYKVAQKPGKPLCYAKCNDKIIFALPGNPASALVCFYQYVSIALNILRNRKNILLECTKGKLLNKIAKKIGLAYFLKAIYKDGFVVSLEGQDSFIMKSYAEANCLIYLLKEKDDVDINEMVEIYMLPLV